MAAGRPDFYACTGIPCGRKKTLFLNLRRSRIVPPHAALPTIFLTLIALPGLSTAQEKPDTATSSNPQNPIPERLNTQHPTPNTQHPTPEPSTPDIQKGAPTPPQEATPNTSAPNSLFPMFQGSFEFDANGNIMSTGPVKVTYGGVVITADHVEGNPNDELIFSGRAQIVTAGATSYADAIHFYPRTRRYRLDNPRSILTPDFLQNRVYDNVYVTGRDLFGNRSGYSFADNTVETTCIEPFHHYELRSRDAILIPQKRLVLHQTSVIFFGVKLITLPYIVIPLDQKPPKRARTNYLPEFGQNVQEGYYTRFPYEFPIGQDAASYVQVSATQKLGERLRFEQEYLAGKQSSAYDTSGFGFGGGYSGGGGLSADPGGSYNSAFGYGNIGPRLPRLGAGLGPASGGLFTIQGYTSSGFDKNFTTSFRHQQGVGGGNRFGISTELTKQSYQASAGQTTQNTRFDLAHDDSVHGVNALGSINYQTSDSSGFSTSQFTGSLRNSFNFGTQGSNRNALSLQVDLSRLLNTQNIAATSSAPASETVQRTARINTQFQFQHTSREYQYSFNTNKDTPFGPQASTSSFGTLEKLPEFQFTADTINFKGGTLHDLPATLTLNLGRYNEPSSKTVTERLLAGFNIPQISVMRGRTELVTSGGFEQRLYGDGAAEYVTRNNTRLRQHLFGRSGIDLNYNYEQPEGGTPFAFDIYSRAHQLTAESGYLDDRHFQATLRTGYDLTGRSFGKPWQTLSTRLMWRPTPSVRLDALTSYDPNTGKFLAITNQLRLRGPRDFGLDLISRVDPNQPGIRRKFSQINTQFDVPLGRAWRVAGLLRFNGNTGLFESRAAELKHEWDCLEASFSYSENPTGFVKDRQFYLAIRIKGFPTATRFNRGASGEGLGVGIGDIY